MTDNYDRIADIYDVDMGTSMYLSDLAYYVRVARECADPVLVLGCGTGRVLRALLDADIEAIGIDRSPNMLENARQRLGAGAKIACMDMRKLALTGDFGLALLPYSLVTYLLSVRDWQALARGLQNAMRSGGTVVLDAFVPDPGLQMGRWVRDYARQADGHWLVRHKRVTPLGDGCNRIERRYRLHGRWCGRTLQTSERICPYHPDELAAIAERYIGEIVGQDFDYRMSRGKEGARFVTLRVRLGVT